ncbi:MAG: ParM/StbA family protein [Clostridium perfringens]|nr:ParM/StbA family protein [Clostridium butyricum]MDU5776245.1 ParM/StbA family protein [Clostridium perfringens]
MQNYSILGIDIGNATCSTSNNVLFESKITETEPLNKASKLIIDNKELWLGEGNYDTTYRKVDKKNYINFLYGALALSTDTVYNYIVLGLPLSQYKEDKAALTNLVLNNNEKSVIINGIQKPLVIKDVEIYPEGVVTLDDEWEGIVVDIGGRTTDCAMVINERNRRKIINPISLPLGTINFQTDLIKKINNKYSLDLQVNDAERILKNGLILDGEIIKDDSIEDMYNLFVDKLINQLQVEYSLRTNFISLTGGGANLFYNSIRKQIGENSVSLQENSIYANSQAFGELGESIWQ